MNMVSGAGSLSQSNFTARVTCPEMTFVDYYFWRTVLFWFKMSGTAVVLQLISFLFCCGRCFVKSDSEPERFTLAARRSSVVLVTKAAT